VGWQETDRYVQQVSFVMGRRRFLIAMTEPQAPTGRKRIIEAASNVYAVARGERSVDSVVVGTSAPALSGDACGLVKKELPAVGDVEGWAYMDPVPASEVTRLPKLVLNGNPPGFTLAHDDFTTPPEGESTMFGRMVTWARSWEQGTTYVAEYVSMYWSEELARAAHRAKALEVCKNAAESFAGRVPTAIGFRVELGEETFDQIAFQKGRYIFMVGVGGIEPPPHHKDVLEVSGAAYDQATKRLRN
jgi:hypothetical protein